MHAKTGHPDRFFKIGIFFALGFFNFRVRRSRVDQLFHFSHPLVLVYANFPIRGVGCLLVFASVSSAPAIEAIQVRDLGSTSPSF